VIDSLIDCLLKDIFVLLMNSLGIPTKSVSRSILLCSIKAKFHYASWFELKFGLSSSLLAAN